MARKKDERFRFRNFSIFYFQRAKNREDEYHNDASKIQIQKPFSVSKAEGKNTKDLDFAISSSFFKGQKNNYAFKIQIQKRFQFHISSCVDTPPSLEAAASTKGQKISEDLFLVFNSSGKPAKICPNFCPSL